MLKDAFNLLWFKVAMKILNMSMDDPLKELKNCLSVLNSMKKLIYIKEDL
jgi:hypothetical protein